MAVEDLHIGLCSVPTPWSACLHESDVCGTPEEHCFARDLLRKEYWALPDEG